MWALCRGNIGNLLSELLLTRNRSCQSLLVKKTITTLGLCVNETLALELFEDEAPLPDRMDGYLSEVILPTSSLHKRPNVGHFRFVLSWLCLNFQTIIDRLLSFIFVRCYDIHTIMSPQHRGGKFTSVFWCSLCVPLDINYRISSSSWQLIRKNKSEYRGINCGAIVYVIRPCQIVTDPDESLNPPRVAVPLPPIWMKGELAFVWFPSSIQAIHQIQDLWNITYRLESRLYLYSTLGSSGGRRNLHLPEHRILPPYIDPTAKTQISGD